MPKKKKQNIYENLSPWTWPLPFADVATIDLFLEGFMGQNKHTSNDERRQFVKEMRSSLSLNRIEKRRVISSFSTLSRLQFDELMKVWSEERQKFLELEKDHPDDIAKLIAKMEFEWALILNKEHGAEAYLSKYVFSDSSELPLDSLFNGFDHFSSVLADEEKSEALVSLVETLFARSKRLEPRTRENLINTGFHALARSGKVSSSKEILKHPIGRELKKVSKSKRRKQRAFLDFCAVSYLMDTSGLKEIEEEGRKFCNAYRRTHANVSDLSAQMSTYFTLAGDFTKALKASEISLKRYNKDFSFESNHLQRIAKNGGRTEFLKTNIFRNSLRYLNLISCFDDFDSQMRRKYFIDEYFKKPIEDFNEWRFDKFVQGLDFFIPLYFFAEDDTLKNDKGVRGYMDSQADEAEKFMFQLAFSRPLRGGELERLLEAMRCCTIKIELLTFALTVRAISTSRLPLKADRRFVSDTIKSAYIDTVMEKGWILNNEAKIFDK